MFLEKFKLVLLLVVVFSLNEKSSALVVSQTQLDNFAGFLKLMVGTFLRQASIPDIKDNKKLELTNLDVTRASVGNVIIKNPKPSEFKISLKNIDISIKGRFRFKQEIRVPIIAAALPFFGRKKRFIGKVFKKIKNVVKKPFDLAKKVVKTVLDKTPKFKLTTIKTSGNVQVSGKIDLTVTLKLETKGEKLVLTSLPNSCDDDINDFKIRISDNKLKFIINPILKLLRGTIARKIIENKICEVVDNKLNKDSGLTIFSIPRNRLNRYSLNRRV
ncbi:uncharacterized protein LOC143461027 [Clavelina lepadiformis]|uniref:uncharacterized protein LOC143461027 n=1 Tax=Clavelina lepadiformis TaxID=159417 RepID=UPI004042DF9D